MWILRWLHRRRLSRRGLRGTKLHSWFGDRILNKELWRPTRESIARAWLVGFPITVIPFLPLQSVIACFAALFVRGNIPLAVALQYLSNPVTMPVHLSACYFVGKIVQGVAPADAWHALSQLPLHSSSGEVTLSHYLGDTAISLYLGSVIIGVVVGVGGYAIIHHTWTDKPRRRASATPPGPGPRGAPRTP